MCESYFGTLLFICHCKFRDRVVTCGGGGGFAIAPPPKKKKENIFFGRIEGAPGKYYAKASSISQFGMNDLKWKSLQGHGITYDGGGRYLR